MKKTFLISLLFFSLQLKAQYDISTIISGLNNPIAFDIAPDGRYFITLKAGLLQVYDTNGGFLQTALDISDSTYSAGECGLLGICLDPQFSVNHFIYLYYNHFDSLATSTQPRIRVVRYTEVNSTAINPFMVLDIPELGNNHVGGNIHFSNTSTDKLFVTIGENTFFANAQLLDNPYGKILRINSDGTIPSDNPFYDDGNPLTAHDDRIWAYGLRNSFDFTFSPLTDSLYATENGPLQDDEINIIHAGGNYAWPTYTGVTNNPVYGDPIYTWTPTIAPTGILYYHDTLFPQFTNHLLVSIFNQGYIYDLALGNPPVYDTVISSAIAFNFGGGFANANLTLKKGMDGCIYVLHGGFVIGDIFKICPSLNSVIEPEVTESFSFSLGPVPAEKVLLVNFPNGIPHPGILLVYDIFGRLVVKEQLVEGNREHNTRQLNLELLDRGIYFLRICLSLPNGNLLLQDRKFIVIKS